MSDVINVPEDSYKLLGIQDWRLNTYVFFSHHQNILDTNLVHLYVYLFSLFMTKDGNLICILIKVDQTTVLTLFICYIPKISYYTIS